MRRMLAFGASATTSNNMNLPMKPRVLDRRAAVRWGTCAAALGLLPFAVRAQSAWPNKAIRLVVPFAPGGSSEIVARATAAELGKLLGQSVYVENKPGAAGNVAMGEVARADDQHTIILGHIGTLAVNPFIFDKLPYNADTAFKPLSLLSKVPSLYVVHPDLPAKNLKEFIALAKSKPGALNYGSAGNGSAGHLAFEYLKMVSGTFVLHVPYRGTGPQLTDLMGGRLDAAAVGAPAVMQFIKTGKLRCIATGTPQRLPQLPDVPTVAEQGYPGFEMTQWYGLLAPASMTQSNADKLAAAAARAVKEPAAVNLLESEAALVVGSSPAEFVAFIEQEKRRWQPVIARAKIKPD
jgi:tripartite-type tricarboxylate transporter receptor subunit TctC